MIERDDSIIVSVRYNRIDLGLMEMQIDFPPGVRADEGLVVKQDQLIGLLVREANHE